MSEEPVAILYVDDEAHNLAAFRAAFRREFRVFTSERPREAIEMLRQHDVGIVITDQRMPEMMGVQFLEAIIPEFPDTVRMILTGFSDVDAIIRAINSGRVYRYITKPWDEQEMRMVLKGAQELVQLRRRQAQLVQELQARVAEQERIVRTFQRYVPESVVQEALSRADDASLLDGEARVVSVLMSDIRGFTAMAARMDAPDVVSLLNDYFGVMSECVRRHKGSVNKFLGDGLLAIFGAPVSYLENQSNAVLCALDMVDGLDALNERHAKRLGQPLEIGVGINTGEVVVGNIGSEDRVEYTVIGDVVNVAARLQDLTHGSPNAILIGESTYDAVKGRVVASEWGRRELRGRAGEVAVFQVAGRRQEP